MAKPMTTKTNPLEELTDEFADDYVDLVYEFAEDVSPVRPWYHVDLKPDEQVARWWAEREPIVTWLMEVAPFMGWRTLPEVFSNLRTLFTSPEVRQRVPVMLQVDERADSLKMMVQAQGPNETAKHLRRVEAMLQRRITT